MQPMPETLTFEERQYADWILRIERRAILPLKWILLAVCLVMWLWATRWALPPIHIFMLFFLFTMMTLSMTFFIRARRVPAHQAKAFAVISYFTDMAFVTLLFVFDAIERRASGFAQSEFYLLYFLIVLRGFALFRAPLEHLFMSILISVLFAGSLWIQEHSFRFITERTFLLKFALIWLVILLAWFIIELINQQQREVMETRERLVRSESLARLGEVAAGIAHEINNPIGIIAAYSEFLMRQSDPADPKLPDYDTIHRESLRCKTIINQMLALASPTPLQFAPVTLEPLFAEVFGVVRDPRDGGGSCTVEGDFPPSLPPVRGQPDQLRQAFLNILLNARQALPAEGGKIRVSARRVEERASAPVQILITDNGCGIDDADREKVFEPFYSKRAKGTGLGLAITRRIIEAHGGSIALRPSDTPPGTTVEILLQAEDSPYPPTPGPATEPRK